jgi:hypothetical protein
LLGVSLVAAHSAQQYKKIRLQIYELRNRLAGQFPLCITPRHVIISAQRDYLDETPEA